MRVVTTIACLLVLTFSPALSAQRVRTDTVALQRLLVAEDARGLGADGLAPIVDGLASRDTLLRRVAVRAVGRLQRPDLGVRLVPLLSDASPAIRAEAANAMAQSLRRARRGAAAASGELSVAAAQAALTDALAREKGVATAGIIARSLGRLVLADSAAARAAEAAIVAKGLWVPSYDLAHGLFRIAQVRRATGNPSSAAVELMRRMATTSADAGTRRLSVLALRTAGALDGATTLAAMKDRDAQVRRLALAGVTSLSLGDRSNVLRDAFADPSTIVRVDAIAAARAGNVRPDCAGIIGATNDREHYVQQMAVDALGGACADSAAAVASLVRVMDDKAKAAVKDHQWQLRAHALVALARRDPSRARTYMEVVAGSALAAERAYAVKAAGAMSDTARLIRFAADPDHNVMETAVAELARVAKRAADSVYIRALGSPGNQVVLAAATALAGSQHERTLPALLDAFDAMSARKSENTRDPRLAMLKRVEEIGAAAQAARLRPYLADYDTTVAQTVAGMIGKWTGETVKPSPVPLPIRPEPLASVFMARNTRIRVTMAASSGGGSFTMRLFGDEAPATVARYLRLAREHYFDSHVLQRVEPNFVIQGGGPDGSEYVGETTFMRDEVSARPHLRGTAGVSSRGRDTGDAQLFLNLVDNPVLDHEYTVFGEVVEGMDVVDHILEGDVIAHIQILK
ncbi:MAG: peptidylprolyl isomerase [Gemmatimonadaceae bacterium]